MLMLLFILVYVMFLFMSVSTNVYKKFDKLTQTVSVKTFTDANAAASVDTPRRRTYSHLFREKPKNFHLEDVDEFRGFDKDNSYQVVVEKFSITLYITYKCGTCLHLLFARGHFAEFVKEKETLLPLGILHLPLLLVFAFFFFCG